MPDEDESLRSFEAPATRVRPHGGRGPLVAGLVAVGLFLVLALVKPWGGPDRPAAVGRVAPTRTGTAASVAPARSADPAFDVALSRRSPDVDGRAPGPVERPRDPASPAIPLLETIAEHVGSWGIGAGGWTDGGPDGGSWTTWQETQPKRWNDPAVLLGFVDRERVCGVTPHLQAGASLLAITSPPSIRPDWVVKGWVVGRDGTTVIAPQVERISASSSAAGGISALVFSDGSIWADGVYRLLVQGSGMRLAIDVCLGSGGQPGVARTPEPRSSASRAIEAMVARLVVHSGDWGVGSAAWETGSGSTPGSASSDWRPVEAIVEDSAAALTSRPSCPPAPTLPRGTLIALTVPRSISPDWRAEVIRFDGAASAVLPGVRQVSPPGNRGITYLERADGSKWLNGAYRFRILTPARSVSLVACLGAD